MKCKSNLNKPVTWNILVKFLFTLNMIVLISVLSFELSYVKFLQKENTQLENRVELQSELIQYYINIYNT